VRADEDEGVVDSRFVAIRMQHTLMEMPANDYRPRLDDPRIGYFAEQVTDLTSSDSAPYRDLINRWHLKKKDPGATLSEPVEPIVWWIENTTPHAWRQTIRDAVLAWNTAFEAAGFKNALVVKTQPDDATWDAGDIRYNVLRWTSSPDPPFGGYGPHYANPRTGQILGADIMLEWSFLTSRVRFKSVFSQPATDPEADHCRLCSHLHESQLAGRFHLDAIEAPEGEKKKLIREALHYLILHEVGHTLGLSHNMRSSQLHAPKDLHNTALTRRVGLVGSVMDYPAVNLAGRKQKQGQYYTTRPGPYDVWAIQFGYTPLGDDPARAEAWREKILSRSIEPEHAFGNDADDMRWAGKAIDPRVMVRDLSSDAITWSERRIDLIQETLSELQDKYAKAKRSHHDLRTAYYVLLRQHRRATAVLSRYIGGVYVDRAKAHQPGAPVPYHPVPSIEQKRAMTALRRHVFGPNAFARPQKLLQHLRVRRRGFDFSKKTEDPKIHQQALSIQSDALDHLLHPRVVRRITDTRLYGNTYDFGSVMKDLTDAVFADDAKTNVNTFRQNLQTHYLRRVIGLFENEKKQYDNHARAIALKTLRDIQHRAKRKEALKLNAETQAHTAHLRWLIDRTLHPRS
ncbi:MAG: zinc-dependent metalloprotease, partial [Phycisphaeraceae bacterium]|nr:zinc-dependent metalloprotease [Phycisphaeraceae bacterium]